jgi:DNA-binding transcriptional MerR regulator
MARFKDKEKAIKLRLQSKSYSQIKKELNVSKSTLSNWLKNYPLSEEKIRELRDWNPKRIEKCRNTKLKKKLERLKILYLEEEKSLAPLTKRDVFIGGLFLYWGEGTKTSEARTSLSNTNPIMIKFFIQWLRLLNIPLGKIKIYLHLYNNMSVKKEINYWSKKLDIPKNQFAKPYIKANNSNSITHKGTFGHGTCNVIFNNARFSEKILTNLQIIENRFKL